MLALALAALALQIAAWALLAAGLSRVRARVRESRPGPAPTPAPTRPPLSVVVAARNEEKKLPALLDALEGQDFSPFEAVVVDDRSTDATALLVEARAAEWAASGGPVLRLVRVAEGEPERAGLPPKKHALACGVAAAHHARVVLTDADTRPPPTWLSCFARYASEDNPGSESGAGSAVLVGHGPYARRPGGLNLFVRYETALTAVQAAAAVGLGRPFMAVGRNFSYPKGLLDRMGGFAHSARSLSGDDDLFVQAVARQRLAPVRYVLDAAAFVPSEAPADVRTWLRQKRRHASAGRFYPKGALVGLAVFHASNLVVWLSPFALGWTGAALLAAKLLAQRAVLKHQAGALIEPDVLALQPLLDLGYALYQALAAVLGALPLPRRW